MLTAVRYITNEWRRKGVIECSSSQHETEEKAKDLWNKRGTEEDSEMWLLKKGPLVVVLQTTIMELKLWCGTYQAGRGEFAAKREIRVNPRLCPPLMDDTLVFLE